MPHQQKLPLQFTKILGIHFTLDIILWWSSLIHLMLAFYLQKPYWCSNLLRNYSLVVLPRTILIFTVEAKWNSCWNFTEKQSSVNLQLSYFIRKTWCFGQTRSSREITVQRKFADTVQLKKVAAYAAKVCRNIRYGQDTLLFIRILRDEKNDNPVQ